MQKQKIVNWSEQALEILGTALLQNRSNMAYTMLSSTEMIVRCKEDNWKIFMTDAGLFHLYHNNYVMVSDTERRFTNGYHDQKIESANLQELINYIAGYSWDKHLLGRGIEIDRTIFKLRIIENGEISRAISLKKAELNEYKFIPFRNHIRDIQDFDRKKKSIKKLMINILLDGKKSTYELICAIDEEEKSIYIAEGIFNVYWEHIQGEKVDMSQMCMHGKKAFVGRNNKIQYTGILEPEQDSQNLIRRRNRAMDDERFKYITSDMDNFVHHKTCKKVEGIKYWEFDALEEIPLGRKVCPCCQDKIYTRGEYMKDSDENVKQNNSIKRGDVYYADLSGIEQSIGCEQTGKRPVLVIQNDIGNNHSTTTIVAILTSKIKKNLPTHVILSDFKGLSQTSAVCLEQIKTIDKSRLEDYCGNIGPKKMKTIDDAIMVSVGIKSTGKNSNQLINIGTKKEGMKMALLYNETVYDGQNNDWMYMIGQHMEFYSNIEQYISNLKIEQEKLEREIEELLVFMEENNCNAAQGFKLYKFLRERRIRRKEIMKELQLLDAWTETIECQQMIQLYQQAVGKMQQIKVEQERKCAVHNFLEEAS